MEKTGSHSVQELYLHVHHIDDEKCECSLPTNIVLFVLAFCDAPASFSIRFVRKNLPNRRSAGTQINLNLLKGFSYEIVEDENLNEEVKQCALPASKVRGYNHMIHSGLCGVLRQIIKHACRSDQNSLLQPLLGYKGMCLKSCAEVSVWTKFCEVEMPACVEKVLKAVRSSETPVTVPAELLKLDNHLRQPPIVCNIGKRRKEAFKQLKQRSETVLKQSSTESGDEEDLENANCPEQKTDAKDKLTVADLEEFFQHNFAEGVDMTLTDLILFPCLQYFLESLQENVSELAEHLPKVYQWYQRMWTLQQVSRVANMFGMSEIKVSKSKEENETKSDSTICWPTLPMAELNIRDSTKTKPKLRIGDVDQVIDFLQQNSIEPKLVEPPGVEDMLLDWSSLPKPAHPIHGELPAKRVDRKCQQLENLVAAVMHVVRDSDVIVDFCSGGGHLGILLAYFLPDCKVILVENKEESIERARYRIDELNLTNVTMYQSNLDYFHGRFNVGVCLHACGVATDLVLNRCLENKASFVICPCCYGAVQNTHTVTYPRSKSYKDTGISYQDYIKLGHAADQTAVNLPNAQQGKLCMCYIDMDRAMVAQEHGYEVQLCTLKPPDCTPKNNLLIGWPKD